MNTKYLSGLKNILSLLVCAGLLFGCQAGQDGEPGPQGPAGPAGAKGLQGAAGVSGTPRVKSGSIVGTISGQRADGQAVNETFNFQYLLPNTPTTFKSSSTRNTIDIMLSDSLQAGSLRFFLETDGSFRNPKMLLGHYETKKLEGNQYVKVIADYRYLVYNSSFTAPAVTGTFSNVAYDAATGMLSGNFDWLVDNTSHSDRGYLNNQYYDVQYHNGSSSGHPLRIKGVFNVPLKQRSYRVGAGQ